MDERLARTEEQIRAQRELLEEKFSALSALITEKFEGLNMRCSGCLGRLEALEKSSIRTGERVGRLEASHLREEGGWLVVAKLLAAGAVLGGLALKALEWITRAPR